MSIVNANLSRPIQISQCDIDFWTQQITEHTLFIYKLLDPIAAPFLRKEAMKHYDMWYNILKQKQIYYNPRMISSLYSFLETLHNKTKIPDMASELGGRNGMKRPISNGLSEDDFHALINHMILEQTYFSRLAEGKMTIREELLFWIQENNQHTELVSHLLPPGEFKRQTSELSKSLKRVWSLSNYDEIYFRDELKILQQSNQAAAMLHNAIHSRQITSVDDAMLEHEMREAQKGEQRVQYLLSLIR